MNKVILSTSPQGVICKLKSPDGMVDYISDGNEFFHLLNSIINRDYIVRVNGNNLSLKMLTDGKVSSLLIKDFEKVFSVPELDFLTRDVEETIETKGFVDITRTDTLNKKHNRTNKNNNALVKKVTAFVLASSISIGAIAGVSMAKERDDTTTQNTEIVATFSINEEPVKTGEETTSIEKEDTITLDYEDLSGTEKAENTKENYYDYFVKYSSMYGLDADLLLAIATQERGVHSSTIDDGGGIGLMQIQYSVWVNEDITCYKLNENTGTYEPEVVTITDAMLRNVETNIETGCMILQTCLRLSDYNIPVAVQMYNMGMGAMNKILAAYSNETGLTKEEILANPEDTGWIKYRNGYSGDAEYLENVNRWVSDNDFTVIDTSTLEPVSVKFTNKN